ncbi:MAG: response regulator [Planctomycetes bacterium]|nr:response regulator [Planctomycetota bacterium]MCC7172357.1 response regulator [Planctomycetota bacterium]
MRTSSDFRSAFGAALLGVAAFAADASAMPDPPESVIEPISRVFDVRSWGVEDGLPHITVTGITEADDAFVWVTTWNGAARFDGASFRRFTRQTAPEVTNEHFTFAFADRRGRVFIASLAELLLRENGYWKVYRGPEGWPGGRVWSIAEDADGVIWAAVEDKTLRLVGESWSEPPPPPLATDRGRTFVTTIDGRLYAWDSDTLVRRENDGWIAVERDGPLAGTVFGVAPARVGGLWIATATHVGRLVDGRCVDVRPLPDALTNSHVILLDEVHGALFAGSYEHGLVAWLEDGRMLWDRGDDAASGLRHASITALFQDSNGQVLVGTTGGGLARLKRRRVSIFDAKDGLGQNVISMLRPDRDGRLLVASWGSGVTWFDRGRFAPPLDIPANAADSNAWINAAVRTRAGDLWVAPYAGSLYRIPAGGDLVPRAVLVEGVANGNVSFMAEDGDGVLWGSSASALLRITDSGAHQVDRASLPWDADIQSLGVDASGRLVVGTAGAGVWRRSGDAFQRIGPIELERTTVHSLATSADGTLWVGLESGALAAITESDSFVYQSAHGLPRAAIVGCVDDLRGVLWIASAAGLVRVPFASLEAVRNGTASKLEVTPLTRSDGMETIDCRTSGEPRAVRTDDGRLWFATVHGVAMVDPTRFRRNVREAFAHVIELSADGKRLWPEPIDGVTQVTAPPGTRRIELNFAAPNLSAPERLRFEYRFSPDSEWRDAGNSRKVVLEDVERPVYEFEVRAVNPDGVRATRWPKVHIGVDRFYWQSRWFQVLIVCGLVVGAGGAMFLLQSRRVAQHRERLTQARELSRERELARRAVAALSETLQLVIDAAPASIGYLDRELRFRWVNRAYADWHGSARDAMLGRTLDEVVGTKRAQRTAALLRRALAGETVREEHAAAEDGGVDGGRLESLLVQDRAPDGSVAGVVHFIVDVSDRRRAERERLELERKLQETARLESLGVLAGGIAHDFNNILTGILGSASLARLDVLPDSSVAHLLAEVERSAERAAELCRQLLAYSGRGRFDIRTLDLSRFVEETAKLIRASISKTVEVDLRLAERLPAVSADVVQLRQVVMNLLINAAESIGDRPGRVVVSTAERMWTPGELATFRLPPPRGAGRYVVLEVEDDGCGMDDATRARVFEPFFTTKFTGRGLGMSAVLGIVRGHGGGIRVLSAPGRGSTFTVLLERSGAPAEPPPAVVRNDVTHRGSGTILVADDESSVRTVVVRALQGLGFRVVEAEDGAAAVEAFAARADEIDLVVMDLEMPKLGGAAAIQRMRARRTDLRVLVMSGHSVADVGALAADAFLHKPFTIGVLREQVFAVLRGAVRKT